MSFRHRRHRCFRPLSLPPAGAWVLLLVSVVLAGCGSGDSGAPAAEPTRSVDPLPSWLVRVEPRPGQEASPLRRVEVHHRVLTGGEEVRLSIDGTDVTQYADFGREDRAGGPGLLVYDFEAARDFVPMDPGEHSATVSRVRLTGVGEQYEVIDSFTWSFSIQ